MVFIGIFDKLFGKKSDIDKEIDEVLGTDTQLGEQFKPELKDLTPKQTRPDLELTSLTPTERLSYPEPIEKPQRSINLETSEISDSRLLETLSLEIKSIKSQNELILEKLRFIEERLRRVV